MSWQRLTSSISPGRAPVRGRGAGSNCDWQSDGLQPAGLALIAQAASVSMTLTGMQRTWTRNIVSDSESPVGRHSGLHHGVTMTVTGTVTVAGP